VSIVHKSKLLIIVLGFLVYFRILFNGFVWDDTTYILGNREIQQFNLVTLVGPNMFNSSGYFRPIPAIYFSLLYHIFEESAFFYHLTQLILHIICTLLLLKIFQKFFTPPLSLLLSLIFLVHPINVESVAYIGSTQSQIYFIFGSLAILSSDILKTNLYLFIAIFTKEVSFLYLILVYFYRWLYKLTLSLKFISITVVSLLIYFIVRFSVLGGIFQKMHLIPISEISLLHRLAHIPIVHFYYLKTFFYPKILVIDQIWLIKDLNWSNFYLPLIIISLIYGLLIGYLIHLYKNDHKLAKPFLFFFVWYALGMGMISQIFPLDMTVADRWFYFPIVGLLGMIGIFITKIKINKMLFAVCILILLSARTVVRTGDWKNALTLYQHDTPLYENYDLENFLGYELAKSGLRPEALKHFIRASVLLPHDTNLFNIASTYEELGDYSNAILYYDKTLNIRDRYLNHSTIRELAFTRLTRLLVIYHNPRDVLPYLQLATSEFPQNGTFWSFLAITEYKLKNRDVALDAATKAKTLLPNPTTAKLYNLILNNKEINIKFD